MALLLCIETTTKSCSVCLVQDRKPIALHEDHSDSYSHAEQLHVFIEQCLSEASLGYSDLHAIAVSEGPGSYTGLRIGVSAAKGLAYALSIPMIAVSPLQSLAALVHSKIANEAMLLPMIDARRMEVYCAGYRQDLKPIFPTRAEIVEPDSFPEAKAFPLCYFFGDGADKCAALFAERPALHLIPEVKASAAGMAALAADAFERGQFVDTAYFEPFYLKDFVAGKAKQKP